MKKQIYLILSVLFLTLSVSDLFSQKVNGQLNSDPARSNTSEMKTNGFYYFIAPESFVRMIGTRDMKQKIPFYLKFEDDGRAYLIYRKGGHNHYYGLRTYTMTGELDKDLIKKAITFYSGYSKTNPLRGSNGQKLYFDKNDLLKIIPPPPRPLIYRVEYTLKLLRDEKKIEITRWIVQKKEKKVQTYDLIFEEMEELSEEGIAKLNEKLEMEKQKELLAKQEEERKKAEELKKKKEEEEKWLAQKREIDKKRKTKLRTTSIGDRVCYSQNWRYTNTVAETGFFSIFNTSENYKMMVITYVEKINGDKMQIRVANIKSSDGRNYSTPEYKGVKLIEGSIHWINPYEDFDWVYCE